MFCPTSTRCKRIGLFVASADVQDDICNAAPLVAIIHHIVQSKFVQRFSCHHLSCSFSARAKHVARLSSATTCSPATFSTCRLGGQQRVPSTLGSSCLPGRPRCSSTLGAHGTPTNWSNPLPVSSKCSFESSLLPTKVARRHLASPF